ncbi:hypothetical protein [Heyndrickxia camelliae]|uniref:Uncharacterized protein n=1 Tax=Heyndrickxia camelliae TaxID=1707093 RepID=A0A2N3LE76_9BACI|nr:hypothetical protein [Heyndrickxia camelliae]PKR82875.1 hypothetical protein CWO92_22050 [Heyndrickxia camelliae]
MRKPSQFVNYQLSSFTLNEESFPVEINLKEVINLAPHQKKKYQKIIKTFIGTTVSFLMLSSRSMAQGLAGTASQPSSTLGLPPDFIEPILLLIKMALGGSFLLAILLMIAAGTLRMLRQKKQAVEWSNDIIRGFTQILLSIPVIFLIFYVAIKLLGNFTTYISPL